MLTTEILRSPSNSSKFLKRPYSNPVPAGISLPMITFSFRPNNGSSCAAIAAPASTLMVCWKEEAESHEFGAQGSFGNTQQYFSESRWLFAFGNQVLVDPAHFQPVDQIHGQVRRYRPGEVTWTLPSILRMITSKCLSLMFWPWAR